MGWYLSKNEHGAKKIKPPGSGRDYDKGRVNSDSGGGGCQREITY